MKKILLLLLFILLYSCQVFGMDREIFKDKFPTAQTYQLIIFSEIKNYLETLPGKSISSVDQNGVFTFQVRPKYSHNTVDVHARIFREVHPAQLHERVVYGLENGQSFSYEVFKSGSKIEASEDLDLLMMRFKPGKFDQVYNIKVSQFNFELLIEKGADKDTSYIILGNMGFNLKIEAYYKEKTALLQYHYFFAGMPSPQNSLNVKAEAADREWGGAVNFLYSSSSAGIIAPKYFFEGLASGAFVYSEAAREFKLVLMNLGFPDL